ncbi:MAG: low molecular weight phosphotyrosine protein phosphatase [Deltaproteobacteria bacterium]|nr:low molecular weight phosphotyrosine protein phosphatase [Deltaproteobacteria bacterium]
MEKVLFVCLGNICRSPTAHGVMQSIVTEKQLSQRIFVDSAGTASYHVGQPADIRSREHAQKRGYQLDSRARQFTSADFEDFDWIIAMDDSNFDNIMALATTPAHRKKVHRFMSFCPGYQNKFTQVPDPYYDGESGFETVLDIVEEGCQHLLLQLEKAF